MNTPKLIAAIDMGSSSFRMVVARVEELNQHCQIYMIDSLREPVRLGAGLDENNNITPETQERALLALQRFGERLRHFEASQVRAVATNALRIAKNSTSFIAQAQAALGFPIDVIEGVEEARLVYCGVAHQLALGMGKRLVVDIGGGSTEFIVGEDYQAISMESLNVGCINIAQTWFADGQISAKAMKNAILQARQEIAALHHCLDGAHWTHAVGSSGTSRALAEICTSNGFTTHGISAKGLEKIKQHVIEAGHLKAITLNGLKNDRLPMMPGGLAVMCAVFEELNIQHMTVTEGGLRQGVLYDLTGKQHHADMREITVSQLTKRYQVDLMHAQQVQQLGLSLFDQLSCNAPAFEAQRPLLIWACLLHEVGLCVSHNGHQKHAAYLLKNADMPGFSQQEQHLLARWVLNHTGKLSKATGWKPNTPADWAAPLCLRLSTLFLRRRQAEAQPKVRVTLQPQGLLLQVPQKYIDSHPLTQFSLEEEVLQWERLGVALTIRPC